MEARPYASICNFVDKHRHIRPMVGYTGSCWTCHRDIRNVVGSECSLDDTSYAATQNAMGTRILRVHRCLGERLPGWLAICSWIAVDVAIANGGDGTPEPVVVLGIQYRDQCIIDRESCDRHKSRALKDVHPLGHRELSQEGMIGDGASHEPEAGSLGLHGRSLWAYLCAIILDLIEVLCPFPALERNRRTRPELGRTLQ